MGIESEIICDALRERECSDFGGTLSFGNNQSAPCSIGTAGFGGRLTSGGISPGTEVMVTVRKEVLKCDLKVGLQFKLTDSRGTVRNVKIAKEGIRDCIFAWEITFVDQNQNA